MKNNQLSGNTFCISHNMHADEMARLFPLDNHF